MNRQNHLFHVLLLFFFIWLGGGLSVSAQQFTIMPNGVVSPGSLLTLDIQLPAGAVEVEFSVVRKEAGSSNQGKTLVPRTPIMDGQNKGLLVDNNPASGKIRLVCRLTQNFTPGVYVFLVYFSKTTLPTSVLIEVKGGAPHVRVDGDNPLLGYFNRGPAPEGKTGDLFLLDTQTYTVLSPLTQSGDCMQPTWSRQGNQIAYIRWVEKVGQLWLLAVEKDRCLGEPQRLLKDFAKSISYPLWSPNGQYIAFLAEARVWVLNLDSGSAQQVPGCEGVVRLLAWTTNSQQLIFFARPANAAVILTKNGEFISQADPELQPEERFSFVLQQVDVFRGRPQTLLYDGSWGWVPYLSPDGQRLLFPLNTPSAGYTLWSREGERFTKVEPRQTGFDPAWAPSGQQVVFVASGKKKELVKRGK